MPMPAIITKYLGPTNLRGPKIQARIAGSATQKISVAYDHAADMELNHARAMTALTEKLGLMECEWIAGSIPDGLIWVRASLARNRIQKSAP